MTIDVRTPDEGGPARLRLFVALDPFRPASPALMAAAALARTVPCDVDLVSARPHSLVEGSVDAFLSDEHHRCETLDLHADSVVRARRVEGASVVAALLAAIDDAERGRPDLVVLDSHGRSPVGELLLGSVSADLVRSSPVPTLLAGPACRTVRRFDRLVVAVDGSDDSLAALDVSRSLVVAAGGALAVGMVEATGGDVAPDRRRDVAETSELHRIAAHLDPPVRDWDVLHGDDPAEALVDHVAGSDGTILVVGTHGATAARSPLPRARLLGGVAARAVRHATVPVLIVSPEAAAHRPRVEATALADQPG